MNWNRMSGTHRRVTVTLALVVCSSTAALADGPDLHLGFGNPAYTLAATCDLARPLVILHVSLQNDGADPTAETTLTVSDDRQTLAGEMPVPTIDAGANLDLAVELHHLGGGAAADVSGDHAVVVIVGDRSSEARTVSVPAALCGAAPPGARAVTGSKRVTKKPAVEESATNVAQSPLVAALTPPVPTGVRPAFGWDDCAAHAGNGVSVTPLCSGLRASGHLVLLWDWKSNGIPAKLSGYRVYRSDHDGKRLLLTVPTTWTAAADITDVPGLNLVKCYAVSAYAENIESPLSAPFCVDESAVVKVVRLAPVQVRSHREQANSQPRFNRASNENAVIVGFSFDNQVSILGGYRSDSITRAAMLFDVSRLSGRRIDRATLSLKIAHTEGAAPQYSCATTIGLANGYWWQNADQIDANFGTPIFLRSVARLPSNGPDIAVDVRSLVEQWVKGGRNFGIALRNDNERSDDAPINKTIVCETTYFDPALEITYF